MFVETVNARVVFEFPKQPIDYPFEEMMKNNKSKSFQVQEEWTGTLVRFNFKSNLFLPSFYFDS